GVPEQVPREDLLGEEPSQSHLIHGPRISSHGESCTTKLDLQPSFGPGHGHRAAGGPPFASGRPRSLGEPLKSLLVRYPLGRSATVFGHRPTGWPGSTPIVGTSDQHDSN